MMKLFLEYRSLLKILKKKITDKDFYKNNQGDVINTAHIMAEKINSITKQNNIKEKYKFLDIGCGLGQITNQVALLNGTKILMLANHQFMQLSSLKILS